MSYANNFKQFYNGGRGNFSFKPFNRQQYGQSNGYVNSGKPRSGCRIVTGRKDPSVQYCIGWKVGRHGFRKFIAAPPRGGAKVRKSKNGREWLSCCVTVENVSAMTKSNYPGWIDPSSKRVFVKALNLLMNPQSGRITQFRKNK